MGCDIHAHWEVKINEKWHHYGQPNIKRDYRLFTKMAGVRAANDEIEPIALPRGLPDDITEIVRFDRDYMGEDGHSDSWLGVGEIQQLYRFYVGLYAQDDLDWHREFGYLFGNGWEYPKEYPESYPKQLQDFRLVFWFNN